MNLPEFINTLEGYMKEDICINYNSILNTIKELCMQDSELTCRSTTSSMDKNKKLIAIYDEMTNTIYRIYIRKISDDNNYKITDIDIV